MAQVYFKLILGERRTIDDVPEHLKAEVQQLLDDYHANNAI